MSRADPAPAEARAEPLLTHNTMSLADWLNISVAWIEAGEFALAKGKIEEVAEELTARDDAALARAPAAGADRVLVPREPTLEMLLKASYLQTSSSPDTHSRATWAAMIAAAPAAAPAGNITFTEAEYEEAGKIGERDGYERAVADIDRLTGGDGEYVCSMGAPSERHCPTPEAMIERIVARFGAARPDPAPPAGHPVRCHFTDASPFTITTAEGEVKLGAGWLAITEAEYRALLAPAAGVGALVDRTASGLPYEPAEVHDLATGWRVFVGPGRECFDLPSEATARRLAKAADDHARDAIRHAALRRDPGAGVPEELRDEIVEALRPVKLAVGVAGRWPHLAPSDAAGAMHGLAWQNRDGSIGKLTWGDLRRLADLRSRIEAEGRPGRPGGEG